MFLIVAVDYFSKRVEAEAVVKIDEATTQKFLWKNICCMYGIPRVLISDSGIQFSSQKIREQCEIMTIQQGFVAVAHPQANGQVEVSNGSTSWTWLLIAYRTSSCTAIVETLLSLVCGSEAVIPVEIILIC